MSRVCGPRARRKVSENRAAAARPVWPAWPCRAAVRRRPGPAPCKMCDSVDAAADGRHGVGRKGLEQLAVADGRASVRRRDLQARRRQEVRDNRRRGGRGHDWLVVAAAQKPTREQSCPASWSTPCPQRCALPASGWRCRWAVTSCGMIHLEPGVHPVGVAQHAFDLRARTGQLAARQQDATLPGRAQVDVNAIDTRSVRVGRVDDPARDPPWSGPGRGIDEADHAAADGRAAVARQPRGWRRAWPQVGQLAQDLLVFTARTRRGSGRGS